MAQIKKILLIEDDLSTNYLHKRVISKSDCDAQVIVHQNADNALTYLKNTSKDHNIPPNLIFLDVNLPGMSGWEFLDEFRILSFPEKEETVIIMLTTSLHPDHEAKAKEYPELNGFHTKPMTLEMFTNILNTYF